MNGYLLQIEELGGLIDTLSYGAQRITEANRALRDAEPTDLGSTSIDGAGRGFQDRWEYGTGKIAEASELMVKAAGADVPWTTLAFDAAGIASGVYGLAPGPGGAVTDVALLAFQGGVEAGSGSEVPTFWGDLQDYWVPKNVPQAATTGAGVLSPPLLLVTPFWNAIEQGHQKDVEARENR